MIHDEQDEREDEYKGKCQSCGKVSRIISIDVNGDWPARFVPVTSCCEADFDEASE